RDGQNHEPDGCPDARPIGELVILDREEDVQRNRERKGGRGLLGDRRQVFWGERLRDLPEHAHDGTPLTCCESAISGAHCGSCRCRAPASRCCLRASATSWLPADTSVESRTISRGSQYSPSPKRDQ